MLPTWIAQTVQARQMPFLTAQVTPISAPESTSPEIVDQPAVTLTATQPAMPSPSPSSSPNTPTVSAGTPAGRPTRTPTLTPTAAIPDAAIQMLEPGPYSRLVSPLHVRASVKPGGDGRVRIELLGEDGRLLVRKILRYGEETRRSFLDETLEFEIPGVAETGRLQISTHDAQDRVVSLAVQDLILLSIGENEINPPGELTEQVIIQEPRPNKLIQGDTLVVSGMARSFDNQDLLVELIARDGRVVGYRQAFLTESTQGGYTPFVVEVPFKVEAATNVRLTIKANSQSRIEGLIYVISEEILLSP
jgi:hypothetical protein